MSNDKEDLKKGPHKPSNSKRVKNTYLDKPGEKTDNAPKLAAMIFDESIDEGIGDYFRAFWKGLSGETYGDLSSFVDPNIDPKSKVFLKAMKEPLTIQEEWMVNNRVMSKDDIMKYREMKTFDMLYSSDINNLAPHILPGAKEKLNYYKQVLPAFKAKYDAGVDAAERALGIDDYRHKRRHYPGRVIVASDGSKARINPETGEVEEYRGSIQKKRASFLRTIQDIADGLESSLKEIEERKISVQKRRLQTIEELINELKKIENELSSLSDEDLEKVFPVKVGTTYKKGVWRHAKERAATELTRVKHLLANS